MQKYIFIFLGCLAFILPIQRGYAEEEISPGPVTDLQAQWVGEKILLTWKQVSFSGGIQGYNIYYSSESIITNNGSYEDMQVVTYDTGAYIFEKTPLSSKEIYITMLAVGKNGQESEGFVVESKIINNSLATKKNESIAVIGVSTNIQTTETLAASPSSLSSSQSLESSQVSLYSSVSSINTEIPYMRNPTLEASITKNEEGISEQVGGKIPLTNTGMETTIISSIALMLSGWCAMKKYRAVH